jgi:hypothetical protein
VIIVPGETVSVTFTYLPERQTDIRWGPIVERLVSKYAVPVERPSVGLSLNDHVALPLVELRRQSIVSVPDE